MEASRKKDLDQVRTIATVLVVIYHVAYIFNSVGVVSNIDVQGIPVLDSVCYFLYPWLMCLMFVLAGISARHSLQTRSAGQFAKERVQKLIVPFFGGAFLLGWLNGWVTERYVDMFGVHEIPGFFKYLIYCMNIGPLWFLLELFLASMILLLIRKADKNDRLWSLAGKAGLPFCIFLAVPAWGSSFLLNTPVAIVFRNGIYCFVFLLGYYVFSHDAVLEQLKRRCVPLMAAAVALGFAQTWYFFGESYVSDACLQHPLTNLYLWIMMLAILGCARKTLNFSNQFTEYMKKRSFALYVFHYPVLITAAYFSTAYLRLPMFLNYLLLLPFAFASSILLYEVTSRIPVLRFLLLGIRH